MDSKFKKRGIKILGLLGKSSDFGDKAVKKIVHMYAIISNGRYTRGSTCIIADPADRLLLVETNYKKGTSFVGGLPNSRHEQPLATAIREIHEEIGVEVTDQPRLVEQYVQKHIRHIDAIFFVQLTEEQIDEIKISDGELSSINWYELEEAKNLLDPDGRELIKFYEDYKKL